MQKQYTVYAGVFFSLLCLLFAIRGLSQSSYTISGNITGKRTGTLYLAEPQGKGVNKIIDSAIVGKGKFVMKGRVEYPKYVLVILNQETPKFGFWLENSKIVLEGNIDSLHRLRLSGSATQLEQDAARKFIAPYDQRYRELAMKAQELSGDSAALKQHQKLLDSCLKDKNQATIAYIKANNNSYPAAAMIKSISHFLSWQQLDSVVNSLSPALQKTAEVAAYRERIATLKRTDVGTTAEDFTQPDPNGNPIRFYDVLAKNKLVLLDFWAAWCGPCRKENPNLVKAYNRFHDQGFEILAISLDKTKEAWQKAIEEDGLPWLHVSELQYWNNPVLAHYGINAVPANILFDSKGRILAKNLKGEALYNAIEQLLAKP